MLYRILKLLSPGIISGPRREPTVLPWKMSLGKWLGSSLTPLTSGPIDYAAVLGGAVTGFIIELEGHRVPLQRALEAASIASECNRPVLAVMKSPLAILDIRRYLDERAGWELPIDDITVDDGIIYLEIPEGRFQKIGG
jgi:hypothetical protein